MAEQKDRVVLAYSGGLDTSVCIKWLQDEKNLDVIALVGDVGQEHDGLEQVKQKALRTGAIECIVADMREEFAEYYLTCAIAANALYENKYPLLSALSRPLISKHLVDIAHEYGAKYVAHGCTGKGNDQVRFEASIVALDPDARHHRPRARMGPEVPPAGNGLGARARRGGAHHQRTPVLHRRQPVGTRHRVRRAGKPLERAARRHLHHDGRSPDRPRRARIRGNLLPSRAFPAPSTAKACRVWMPSWP